MSEYYRKDWQPIPFERSLKYCQDIAQSLHKKALKAKNAKKDKKAQRLYNKAINFYLKIYAYKDAIRIAEEANMPEKVRELEKMLKE